MAFVNLPPNLQDMFYAISDRVAKLETGPNQPGYDADAAQATAVSAQALALSSQSTATTAQTQAINAGIQANIAQSQATIAQSQATIASSQAVAAQTSANGKNTTYYSTNTPGSTANTAGDIWFVVASNATITSASASGSTITFYASNSYPAGIKITTTGNTNGNFNLSNALITSANSSSFTVSSTYVGSGSYSPTGTAIPPSGTIIGQYTGLGGTSWQQISLTSLVISNLDAGKITTGTLSAIEINAGTGGTAFHVSPSGYLSAQGVYIKGNITADSGTFNGTIVALTGYFGGYGTTGNYWSIGSNGITGVGSATITAGQINGSSIYIGSSGQFQVDASGNLNASSATVTGTIHASNGDVGGFTIGSTYLSSGVNFYLNASTGDAKLNSVTIGNAGVYYLSSAGALSASSVTTSGALSIGTSAFISGGTEVAGNLQVDSLSSVTYSSTNYNIGLFGTGSGGTISGRMYKTTSVSSKRFKHNIEPFIQRDYLHIVSKLEPVTFNYNADIVDNPEIIAYGLIAEDVQTIPETQDLVNIGTDGLPESIAYDRINWYVIKAISQINDRLNKLEGK